MLLCVLFLYYNLKFEDNISINIFTDIHLQLDKEFLVFLLYRIANEVILR